MSSNKVALSVKFPEKYYDIDIPALLFIPFIENAFKHGISYREKSFIDISMHVEDEKLIFKCENSVGKQKNENNENNHNGIGLENVKKRLNLLFPDRHSLIIDKTEKVFRIELFLKLKKISSNGQNNSNR